MKSHLLFRIVFFLAALGLGSATIWASELSSVKARMDQRQGAVDALRDRRVAGESFRGFLEARGGATAADQKVIAEENADRRTVYAALAAQNKTTVDHVGRERAQQIAARASAGMWIQDSSGAWRQK